MLINDDIRDKLLQENAGNADNQAYIRRSAIPAYTYINNMPSPRIIKTHIPFTMLPPSVMQKRAKVMLHISISTKQTYEFIVEFIRRWYTLHAIREM